MEYLNADSPMSILENATVINALDRNGITVDNLIFFLANTDSIFSSGELFPDPDDPNAYLSWWEANWKKAVQWIAFALAVIATVVVAIFNPAAGAAMAWICIKGAISGLIIGGIIGGVMSAVQGNSFWTGVAEGAIYGAINGYTTAAIMFGISSAVNAASTVKTANAAKPCPEACFIAGTLVLTKEGQKPIENVEVGDLVWAYNEETGESDWKPVAGLFRNSTLTTHHLSFDDNDEPIVCTPEHPFYILNAGDDTPIVNFEGRDENAYDGQWVQAKYLKVGDKVLLSDGKTAILTLVETEHLSEPITTYNFEVADFHTYYVGEQGVLVHNACPGGEYYRGGSDFSAKPGDVRYTQDGLVKTTHGVSVNTNPASVAKHGVPHKLIDLPDGLTIIQRGVNATHYEIVASYQMTYVQYQNLLSKIVAIPIG